MRKRTVLWAACAAVVVAAALLVWVLSDDDPEPTACGSVRTRTSTGDPLPKVMFTEVVAVHDAACRRDYAALVAHAEAQFTGTPLTELRADGGAPMKVVAETLETRGIMDQGGLKYCHPRAGVAYFPRGTLTIAGKWSGFSLTDTCEPGR
jgi:hypothetical protein